MENELHHQSATFEKIWATLDRIAESQEKAALEMKEMREEEEERRREEDKWEKKKAHQRMIRWERLFNAEWSLLMESLLEGDLVRLLQDWGIAVLYTQTSTRGCHNGECYEFSILAETGDEVVLVEVEKTLRSEDVARFLEKLGKFTTYRPLYRGKKIYGAVAFLKADKSVQVHAERQGLFVIRATGSSASIVNDEEFVPRVF